MEHGKKKWLKHEAHKWKEEARVAGDTKRLRSQQMNVSSEVVWGQKLKMRHMSYTSVHQQFFCRWTQFEDRHNVLHPRKSQQRK